MKGVKEFQLLRKTTEAEEWIPKQSGAEQEV